MKQDEESGKTEGTMHSNYSMECRRIALIQAIFYAVSFFVVWYRIWWDSLLGFFLALVGFYSCAEEVKEKGVTAYYYGNHVSLALHAGAMIYAIYLLFLNLVQHTALNEENTFGTTYGIWGFFVVMIFVISVQIALTLFAIQKSRLLQKEIEKTIQNESYVAFDETAALMHGHN